VPGLGYLVGRFADNDDRVHMRKRNDPDSTACELRAHQGRKPARHVVLLRLRRQHRELAHRVHEHDADMPQILEVKGEVLV
jgi:hypothetical protein